MKNKRIEKILKLQKKEALLPRPSRDYNKDGIRVYHIYDYRTPDDLSYWDDLQFKFGSRLVTVFWVHPRMKFSDKLDDITFGMVEEYRPKFGNWESSLTVEYKKVGKSRKKVKWYSTKDGVEEEKRDVNIWVEKRKEAVKEVIKRNELTAGVSFGVRIYKYSRGVELCAPIEINSEDDLKTAKDLTIKLLRGETTLEKEFPNYVYTCKDYITEEERSKNQVHNMA